MATPTDSRGAGAEFLAFRLPADARCAKLAAFNRRGEIRWFGFERRLAIRAGRGCRLAPASRPVGADGCDALNGAAICAGFDAAFVLAGLAHFDPEVVVALELSTQFPSLARVERPLAFRAGVTRSSRAFAFAQGVLAPLEGGAALATATAMRAPTSGGNR